MPCSIGMKNIPVLYGVKNIKERQHLSFAGNERYYLKVFKMNGIILFCRKVTEIPIYKYIDVKDGEVIVVNNESEILIYVHDEIAMELRKRLYKNVLAIVVNDNTPDKVYEYSQDMFVERIPTYEDHVLSNMFKEEMIELKRPLGFLM